MNVAVILAGGIGERMKSPVPKQFMKIGGKMLIEYSLEIFQNNENISFIVIVCNKSWIDFLYTKLEKYNKVRYIVNGGNNGHESTENGINLLKYIIDGNDKVIIHDAARPFITNELINTTLEQLDKSDWTVCATDINDYPITYSNTKINDGVLRTTTPVGCIMGKVYDLYKNNKHVLSKCTIDLLISTTDEKPFIIKCNTINSFKVTNKGDFEIIESIINFRNEHKN